MVDYIKQIEEKGYCRIPQVLSPEQVQQAMDLTRDWHQKSANSQSENVPFLNRNHPIVYNLQSKDLFFVDLLFQFDVVSEILHHFLNDVWYKPIPQDKPNYILRAYSARSSNDRLPMHIDSFVPYGGPHVFIVQMAMILEDQTTENGCTVVVPGSHLAGEYATQESFADAIPIESNAGDLVIWDSRLWHGTLENVSGGTRWALIATYCRWWLKQHFSIPDNMPQEIYEQLTVEQKAVMGFCAIPHRDETFGIDMKSGYEKLPGHVDDVRRGVVVTPFE